MKVTGGWLSSPSTQAVFDAYEQSGYAVYAVGGCVRNALLQEPVSDIDMSSDAPPDTATAFLKSAGFKVIPTGIDHGTITVVRDGVPFEITTYRKDVETDGRRAVVAFSQTLEEDAQRRDFTINALYADRNGNVVDPVDGLTDIKHRCVRFIGGGASRIREDYLRTLRFFRFHARYADPENGFDADALAAIAENLDGLATLSRERVGAEMLKLVSVTDPAPALMTMMQTGVLNALLPRTDPKSVGPLMHAEHLLGLSADPIRRLAAFVHPEAAATLRLSKSQSRDLTTLRDAATGSASALKLGYRLKTAQALSALALRSALLEMPVDEQDRVDVETGNAAIFPISAKDLPKDITGKQIGEMLRKFEAQWIASRFSLTKSQLLG